MGIRSLSRIEPSQEILAASRRWLAPIRGALGADFVAAYLSGSVLTQGFDAKRSKVNLLVAARALELEALDRLARALPEDKRPPHFDPLFLTERQIRHSLDSFPIEWIEIQEAHLLIEGHDVLGEIDVPRTYLRLQCEHELRAKLIQLRQAYIQGAKHPDRLGATLKASASGYATLFRTLIRLNGESPPAGTAQVIERVAQLYRLNAEGLLGAHVVRISEHRYRGAELLDLYRKFLVEAQNLVAAIDAMRVS